jgi:hypothetical protein
MTHKETAISGTSPNKSPLSGNMTVGVSSDLDMSFKSIKQNTMSPLRQKENNDQISTNKKNKFGF